MVERYNGVEADPEGVYVMFEDFERVRTGLSDLIKSCQAIIDNRHEDLGDRDDVEPYLKNRLMIARKAFDHDDQTPAGEGNRDD